ncbi:hypothetical protein OPQ81_003423 [Rhizoctonia solani]|nr:hypothetical protein OPQ81_003423 [Rhizoctonia solani]
MPPFVHDDHHHVGVIDLTQMEDAPLPAPSTSRTPGPRLSLKPSQRRTNFGTQRSTPVASSVDSGSVVLSQTPRPAPLSSGSRKYKDKNTDYINYDPAISGFPADSEYISTISEVHNSPRKRQTDSPDIEDSEEQGPLLSEYVCPICYSPPRSAIVTLCGHILCGPCLHGATTTRQAAPQPLCPVCRTPLPNLRFAFPSIQFNINPDVPLNVMNQHQPPCANVGNDTTEDKWDPEREFDIEVL